MYRTEESHRVCEMGMFSENRFLADEYPVKEISHF